MLRSQIRIQGFQEQRPSCATRKDQVLTYEIKYVHVICMQKGSTLLLEQRVTSKKYSSSSLVRQQKAQDRCIDEKFILLAADSVMLTALMKKKKLALMRKH